MSAIKRQSAFRAGDVTGLGLRLAIVVLALATAYIHNLFGGLMFTANAVGYVVLAAAMAAPIAIVARYRWLVRAGLAAFTLATIFGWVLFGGRFTLAYVDKALEVALIAGLLIEMWRYDGGPIIVLRRIIELAATIVRMPFAKATDS
jgi:hypothetical protein